MTFHDFRVIIPPVRSPRITKQIHLPADNWKRFDARVGARNRSSAVDALLRALDAGDVPNFDKHHDAVRAEITSEQAQRLMKNRGK